MKSYSLIAAALVAISGVEGQHSGYLDTCEAPTYTADDSGMTFITTWCLWSGCKNGFCGDNRLYKTVMGLGACLGNNNGTLVAQKNGEAMKSCHTCSSTPLNITQCLCKNYDGKEVVASFDLNTVIGVVDGTELACFDKVDTS